MSIRPVGLVYLKLYTYDTYWYLVGKQNYTDGTILSAEVDH